MRLKRETTEISESEAADLEAELAVQKRSVAFWAAFGIGIGITIAAAALLLTVLILLVRYFTFYFFL